MTQQTLPKAYYSSDRFHPNGELLKETKILFNHQGSDAELVRQIAIAVQAINTLNSKPKPSCSSTSLILTSTVTY